MKTGRRHELQTNELADSLARAIEAVKPYTRAGLALALAVVVLGFTWAYLANQSSRRATQGWTEYFDALAKRDPRDDLNDIATRYAGTPVAQWARVVLADILLDNGTNRLLVDKKDARDELRQAIEKYRSVLLEGRDSMILEQATFGLARAHEALGTPESLDEARKEYRSIGQKWPDSAFKQAAEARADQLDQLPTKNFYDWLAKYEPPRPVANEPGRPGARPDFLREPTEQGVKLPTIGGDAAPASGGEPSATEPASTTPDIPTGPLLPTDEPPK